jgi:hypothetical protein
MKFRYTIVFTFCVLAVKAQVPGFLGKRFIVFLDANPTPALFVQNVNNAVVMAPGGEEARISRVNRFAFNVRPQVTAEYLVFQNFSLGISYSRLMIGTTRAYYDRPRLPDENIDFLTEYDAVKGQAAGIHLKFYQFNSSASIPPIGYYQTLSVYFTQTNTYDDKKSTAKQFKDDFTYPVLSLSFGRQSMIARNLLLKTGVELGWAFVPSNFISEGKENWDAQEYSGYSVHRSLFGYYCFNINIGLGYVVF